MKKLSYLDNKFISVLELGEGFRRRVVFQDLADYTVVCFKFAVSI